MHRDWVESVVPLPSVNWMPPFSQLSNGWCVVFQRFAFDLCRCALITMVTMIVGTIAAYSKDARKSLLASTGAFLAGNYRQRHILAFLRKQMQCWRCGSIL